LNSDVDRNPSRHSPSPSTDAECGEYGSNGSVPPLAAADSDALFLDVDGTLLKIVSHPDAVKVPPDLIALLDRLVQRFGGALALISGRSIDNLDQLFTPLRLPCAGVHGLERRGADASVHRGDAAELLAPLRPALTEYVASRDGLLLEDKGQSLALHFRNAPALGPEAEAFLTRLVAPVASSVELKRGKMVLELKSGDADKGTAIAAFMQEPPFSSRRPVFIGDDVTDEDGFAVVDALGGVTVRVGYGGESVATHRLADEDSVFDWLRRLLDGPRNKDSL